MQLGAIYKLAVEWGIEQDPRGSSEVKKQLEQLNQDYQKLDPKQQAYFDKDRLTNPYDDTRLLYGSPEAEVRSLLAGVDMEIGEILLADRLRSQGRQIDLVLAHHPEGRAMASFYRVMHMQADVLNKLGVPINVAEGILKERIQEVERRVMPANHQRAVDAARLLDIPLICIHTPADNSVTRYLQQLMDQRQPHTVQDVLDLLMEVPEYQQSSRNNNPPTVVSGDKKNRCGKVFVDMTGGTGGSKEAFAKLAQTDIGTIVGMHIGEDHLKEALKNHINVVIAGHMASDSVGINLVLDRLKQHGPLEIISCSGFYRVERT